MGDPPLRILFAAPAWWPSRAFGGPIPVARELVRRLVERGHAVDVVTTTLLDLHGRPARRSRVARGDGALSRHAGSLPLDGDHARAAARAGAAAGAGRRARLRVPRRGDDGDGGVAAAAAEPARR